MVCGGPLGQDCYRKDSSTCERMWHCIRRLVESARVSANQIEMSQVQLVPFENDEHADFAVWPDCLQWLEAPLAQMQVQAALA